MPNEGEQLRTLLNAEKGRLVAMQDEGGKRVTVFCVSFRLLTDDVFVF